MNFPFSVARGREFDVLGFGTNAVDFLIEVPHYPVFNSKIELSRYVRSAGGEVASTMAGLSRLGLKAAYAGRFGSDSNGDLGWASLIQEGVDLCFAERVEGAETQIAFIIIDEKSGERTVIWKRDAKLSYRPNEAPIDAVGQASALHITPHDVSACIRLAENARKEGTVISTDVDDVFDGIDKLLPLVDILITSADVPKKLTGEDDLKSALSRMSSEHGCPVVGVTVGDSGSVIYSNGNFIESSAYAVPGGCKDTTGAGDAFRVGILYGMLTGADIRESASYANAVASLKCRAVGARTALPDKNELESFLSGQGF